MPAIKNTPRHFLTALLWFSLTLSMNAAPLSEKLLFDFEGDGSLAPWQVVNDSVMGGLSTSRFQTSPDKAAIFSGAVSLENNGGFASVRSAPLRQIPEDCDAFKIRVRGDGQRYSFNIRKGSGFRAPSYQCSFKTQPGEWREITLAFKDFTPKWRGRTLRGQPPLNLSKGDSLGFIIANKKAGRFKLEIATIKVSKANPTPASQD